MSDPFDDPDKCAAMFQRLCATVRRKDAFGKMDNAQLVWLWIGTETAKHMKAFTADDDLLDVILERLWPGWDGETITIQEWGWMTPDGPLIYDRERYEFWDSIPEAERI
jgi:hypothetical protein